MPAAVSFVPPIHHSKITKSSVSAPIAKAADTPVKVDTPLVSHNWCTELHTVDVTVHRGSVTSSIPSPDWREKKSCGKGPNKLVR